MSLFVVFLGYVFLSCPALISSADTGFASMQLQRGYGPYGISSGIKPKAETPADTSYKSYPSSQSSPSSIRSSTNPIADSRNRSYGISKKASPMQQNPPSVSAPTRTMPATSYAPQPAPIRPAAPPAPPAVPARARGKGAYGISSGVNKMKAAQQQQVGTPLLRPSYSASTPRSQSTTPTRAASAAAEYSSSPQSPSRVTGKGAYAIGKSVAEMKSRIAQQSSAQAPSGIRPSSSGENKYTPATTPITRAPANGSPAANSLTPQPSAKPVGGKRSYGIGLSSAEIKSRLERSNKYTSSRSSPIVRPPVVRKALYDMGSSISAVKRGLKRAKFAISSTFGGNNPAVATVTSIAKARVPVTNAAAQPLVRPASPSTATPATRSVVPATSSPKQPSEKSTIGSKIYVNTRITGPGGSSSSVSSSVTASGSGSVSGRKASYGLGKSVAEMRSRLEEVNPKRFREASTAYAPKQPFSIMALLTKFKAWVIKMFIRKSQPVQQSSSGSSGGASSGSSSSMSGAAPGAKILAKAAPLPTSTFTSTSVAAHSAPPRSVPAVSNNAVRGNENSFHRPPITNSASLGGAKRDPVSGVAKSESEIRRARLRRDLLVLGSRLSQSSPAVASFAGATSGGGGGGSMMGTSSSSSRSVSRSVGQSSGSWKSGFGIRR